MEFSKLDRDLSTSINILTYVFKMIMFCINLEQEEILSLVHKSVILRRIA